MDFPIIRVERNSSMASTMAEAPMMKTTLIPKVSIRSPEKRLNTIVMPEHTAPQKVWAVAASSGGTREKIYLPLAPSMSPFTMPCIIWKITT